MVVVLLKEKTPRITFTVKFKPLGKDLLVEMEGAFQLLGDDKPFNRPTLRYAAARVGEWLMMNDSDKNPNKKNMQDQIDMMKATRDQLKAVGEFVEKLNPKDSIPFRVYAALSAADNEAAPKVIIFQSGQVENAKAGGTKKNPKAKPLKGPATPKSDEPDKLELK